MRTSWHRTFWRQNLPNLKVDIRKIKLNQIRYLTYRHGMTVVVCRVRAIRFSQLCNGIPIYLRLPSLARVQPIQNVYQSWLSGLIPHFLRNLSNYQLEEKVLYLRTMKSL